VKTVYYVLKGETSGQFYKDLSNTFPNQQAKSLADAQRYSSVSEVCTALQKYNDVRHFTIVRVEETPGTSTESRRQLEEGEAMKDGETVKYAVHVPGCGLLATKNKPGREWGFDDSLSSALLFDTAGDATDNVLLRKVRAAWPFGGAFVTRIAISTNTTEPLITETVLQ
jgi:hypothetical protein